MPTIVHNLSYNSPRAAMLIAIVLAAASSAHAECKATPELETSIKAHADAETYTELGTWFAQQQQFACSSQVFQSALKLDPSSAKLNYFLGLSLYSSGDAAASIAPLRQSAQLDARAIQPRMLLGSVLHELGQRNEAEAQWRAVLQIDPASVDALGALANSLTDGGDAPVAIALLKPAQKNEELTLDLARAYGVANMLEDAAATLQQALTEDPENYHYTNALTTVLVHQHRFQDAVALAQKYVERHPADIAAQIDYLGALVLNNDSATARPLGAKLLPLAPHDFNVLYLNGFLERQAGNYTTARDHLQEAVTLRPEDYDARFNLGTALAHLGDNAGARQQLEKAVAIDNTQAQAHFQLAGVLRSLGQSEGAQQQFKIYKQLSDATLAHSQADTRTQLAAARLAAGDLKQAITLYREALAATPESSYLEYQLAMALEKAGDTSGERAALEQAVKIDPTFALAQNQLGYRETMSNEPDEAEKHFRAAIEAAPAFIDAWINLAATLAQQGHIPEAQQAVASALALDATDSRAQQLSQKLNEAAHPSKAP